MRKRYTEDDVTEKAEEIENAMWKVIDDLGITDAIDEDALMEISYEQAQSYYQGLEDDYADSKFEEERERRAGF